MLSFEEMMMQEAIKQAKIAFDKDEVPVGAVVVYNKQIIARAHNQVESLKDPTAHAEMIAITQATNFLSSKWLQECQLYVTIEPCAMCAGALVLARIERLYYGAKDPKAGACGSVLNIINHDQLNHKIDVISGVFETDCGQILTDFFRKKRQILN